jgi:hypothetical protein
MATNSKGKKTEAGEALKQLTYLASALKAPRIIEAAGRLADHARDAGWTHEEYLAAVLDREVAARNASGAQLRIAPSLCTFAENFFLVACILQGRDLLTDSWLGAPVELLERRQARRDPATSSGRRRPNELWLSAITEH